MRRKKARFFGESIPSLAERVRGFEAERGACVVDVKYRPVLYSHNRRGLCLSGKERYQVTVYYTTGGNTKQ